MTFCAYDELDLLVFAQDVEKGHSYYCTECKGRVRKAQTRTRLPYFYHLRASPACRLYSKSEDHMLAQLSLQRLLPKGETVLEKPFIDILRVADLIWEPKKIVFEFQCSLLTPHEAEKRMIDYARCGYEVVWILDDRIFNRRILRPAEQQIRQTAAYYASLRRKAIPEFYDQFEVFAKDNRTKKGYKLPIRLDRPCKLPKRQWPEDKFPKQILNKVATTDRYFYGDLVHKALLSYSIPQLSFTMQNFRAMEKIFSKVKRERNFFIRWALEALGYLIYKYRTMSGNKRPDEW